MEISKPGPANFSMRLKNEALGSTTMEPATSGGQNGAVAILGRLNFTRGTRLSHKT
jgi:hypothetical protein